ncbi:MAG: hypothetical protein WBG54_14545 [Acidobacteriaceae bacterium]
MRTEQENVGQLVERLGGFRAERQRATDSRQTFGERDMGHGEFSFETTQQQKWEQTPRAGKATSGRAETLSAESKETYQENRCLRANEKTDSEIQPGMDIPLISNAERVAQHAHRLVD